MDKENIAFVTVFLKHMNKERSAIFREHTFASPPVNYVFTLRLAKINLRRGGYRLLVFDCEAWLDAMAEYHGSQIGGE